MARYSLFVLKVPLNTKQTNKQLQAGCLSCGPNQQCQSTEGKLEPRVSSYCLLWFMLGMVDMA